MSVQIQTADTVPTLITIELKHIKAAISFKFGDTLNISIKSEKKGDNIYRYLLVNEYKFDYGYDFFSSHAGIDEEDKIKKCMEDYNLVLDAYKKLQYGNNDQKNEA